MANLEIKIGAKDSTSGVFNKIKTSLGSFSSGFGSVWGKLAGAITAGAVLAKAKSTAAALDDLRDRSENLRMPTDELQRWSYAATDSGLGAEKFGKILTTLNNVIQDSGKGGAAGLAAIEKLAAINIDPNQLKGKSFSDQLGMVFDGLSKVGKESDALAASSDIFGEKMGKNILGLAANWRTLKAEVSSEKIFSKEDIDAGENFTKTLAQLDITIQKLVTGSGLLQWLTAIGQKLDKVYSATPDYKGTSIEQPIDVADAGVRQERINAETERKKKLGVREDVAKLQAKREDVSKPVSQAEKTAYNEKHLSPEQKDNRLNADLDQAFSGMDKYREELKRTQEQQKQALEDNLAATIKRLEANSDVQKLGKITGQSGLTANDTERLSKAGSISERFKIEQQITEEKKKQIDAATEQKKKDDEIADARKSISEQITALDEKRKTQDLINAGMQKEAFIQEQIVNAQKAAADKGTTATPDELAKITAGASALYESQNTNSFKGAQGAIVNDRFSAVGGMGGKMFSQDSTPKQHLAVAQQTQKAVSTIQQNVASIAANSGNSALRAP
jgi:hypothetical protein